MDPCARWRLWEMRSIYDGDRFFHKKKLFLRICRPTVYILAKNLPFLITIILLTPLCRIEACDVVLWFIIHFFSDLNDWNLQILSGIVFFFWWIMYVYSFYRLIFNQTRNLFWMHILLSSSLATTWKCSTEVYCFYKPCLYQ